MASSQQHNNQYGIALACKIINEQHGPVVEVGRAPPSRHAAGGAPIARASSAAPPPLSARAPSCRRPWPSS